MNKLIVTVCVIGTALLLSACETTTPSYNSGSNYAKNRTAGDVQSERVFRRVQSK